MASGNRGGRPENQQETEPLSFRVPTKLAGYLRFLAKNTMLGATHNDVAALILTNALIRLAETEQQRPNLPQA